MIREKAESKQKERKRERERERERYKEIEGLYLPLPAGGKGLGRQRGRAGLLVLPSGHDVLVPALQVHSRQRPLVELVALQPREEPQGAEDRIVEGAAWGKVEEVKRWCQSHKEIRAASCITFRYCDRHGIENVGGCDHRIISDNYRVRVVID